MSRDRGAGRARLPGGRTTRRGRRRRGGADRGSGTVWTLALMAVIWLAAVVVMTAGGVRAVRHRAHTAADQAALAAASRAPEGPAAACRVASAVAVASGGRLLGCDLAAEVADVTVSMRVDGVPFRMLWPGPVKIVVRARAGPALPVGDIRG